MFFCCFHDTKGPLNEGIIEKEVLPPYWTTKKNRTEVAIKSYMVNPVKELVDHKHWPVSDLRVAPDLWKAITIAEQAVNESWRNNQLGEETAELFSQFIRRSAKEVSVTRKCNN